MPSIPSDRSSARSLSFVDVTQPDDPWLLRFFDLYATVFTLEEEREPLEGFQTVLRLNEDPMVQRAFGPLSERITLVIDRDSGAVLGATNYVLYGHGTPGDPDDAHPFTVSCQLNFICVDEAQRGQGLAGQLLDHLEGTVQAFARTLGHIGPVAAPAFITCEQNDPARMTTAQIEEDVRASGGSPEDRRTWWSRRGFRRLMFDYVQPPLTPDGQACDYLDFHARWSTVPGHERGTASVPTALLVDHLRRFFMVSVGKLLVDMAARPEWQRLQRSLGTASEVQMAGPGTVSVRPGVRRPGRA